MRTIPIPAVVLCLLTPLFALAEGVGLGPGDNRDAARSPLTWYWVGVVAIALVAFVVSTFIVSRRRGGPGGPSRTGIP